MCQAVLNPDGRIALPRVAPFLKCLQVAKESASPSSPSLCANSFINLLYFFFLPCHPVQNHTDIFQLNGVCQGRLPTLEALLPDIHTNSCSLTSHLLSSSAVCKAKCSGISLIISCYAFVCCFMLFFFR